MNDKILTFVCLLLGAWLFGLYAKDINVSQAIGCLGGAYLVRTSVKDILKQTK